MGHRSAKNVPEHNAEGKGRICPMGLKTSIPLRLMTAEISVSGITEVTQESQSPLCERGDKPQGGLIVSVSQEKSKRRVTTSIFGEGGGRSYRS